MFIAVVECTQCGKNAMRAAAREACGRLTDCAAVCGAWPAHCACATSTYVANLCAVILNNFLPPFKSTKLPQDLLLSYC